MLSEIARILIGKGLINSQWQVDAQKQGELVKLCRDYYDGFQRLQLTTEMKKMLHISDERLERYNANYCSLVIDRMADRLIVDKFMVKSMQPKPAPQSSLTSGLLPPQPPAPAQIEEETDPAQEWVEDLMAYNRFDGLQRDVTVSYLTDGSTFIISQYDDVEKKMCFVQELAYDGNVGMLVIYERGSYSTVAAAIKIWYDVPPTPAQVLGGDSNISLYRRVNIYYPNQTDKYYSNDGETLVPMDVPEEEVVTVRNGKAPGVPVTPFYNKNGVSELVNIIPLQDSLNSALVDLVMAGRLTAFSLFFAVNVDVPQGLSPGMTVYKKIIQSVNADGTTQTPTADEIHAQAEFLNASRFERIPAGDLSQIIAGIELIIDQIGVISSTPLPGTMGSSTSSGEALKQREVGMLGKLNRAQTQLGNAWEDVIYMAASLQIMFGFKTAPQIDTLDTVWKSAEVRNDTDVLALFKLLNDAGFVRAALRALGQSSLASYTEEDITKMIAEKAQDSANHMISAAGSVPGLGNMMTFANLPDNTASLNFNPPASTAQRQLASG